MISMFESFETDPLLEKEGVIVDYGSYRIRVARAGGANKKYVSYSTKALEPIRRQISLNTIDADHAQKVMYDIYATAIILGWQVADGKDKDDNIKWTNGIHKKGGGINPFNKVNVIEAFTLLPELFTDLQEVATGIELYRVVMVETDAKN